MDDKELEGVLCHETLHILLRHLHEGNRILKRAKEIVEETFRELVENEKNKRI